MIKALILSLSIFIIGCKQSEKTDGFSKKVLYQASEPLQHLDPQLSTGLTSLIQLAKSYEALMETHPYKAPFQLLPNLAEDFPEVSPDGKTYKFKIKKNILFHPHTKLNPNRTLKAEDFITTFKRIADPKLGSPHFGYWNKKIIGLETFFQENQNKDKTDYSVPISGLSAPNDETLIIKIKNPDNYFLNDLTVPAVAPIPIELVKAFNNDFSQDVVGTGAFTLQKYVRKSHLKFKRFDKFRDKYFPTDSHQEFKNYEKENIGKKIPFLDEIHVRINNEAQTRWLNFQRGKLDYLEIPKDNFTGTMTPQKELSKEAKEKGMKLGITPSYTNVYYFGFNNKQPPFSDPHIRRAIGHLVSQKDFNKLFFNDTAIIAESVLPPGIPGNDPKIESPYLKSGLEEALVEIKNSSYKQAANVPPIKISIRNSSTGRQVGEFFVKELAKAGLKASFELIAWGALLQQLQQGQYQTFYLAWFVGLPTGFQFFDLLYGPNYPDSYNRMGFQNSKFDDLYDLALSTLDQNKQSLYFKEMNLIAQKELPLYPLVHVTDFFIQQGWLKNYRATENAGGLEQYFDVDLELKAKLLKKF